MNKIIMGRKRKKSKDADRGRETGNETIRGSHAADAMFVLGAAAVCVMLALPMLSMSAEEPSAMAEDVAVMVMSTGAEQSPQEREELAAPSNAQTEEDWSFYDYIGELFAGLISGQ